MRRIPSLIIALAIVSVFFLSGRIRHRDSVSARTNSNTVSPSFGFLFTVNTTADTPDAVVGNGLCADSSGRCTLRAAIQEANANSTDDTIEFNIPTSDPGYNGTSWTIRLSSALPILSTALTINGPGQNLLSIERDTSLNTIFSIFNITNHPNFVTLSNLAIRFGASGNGGGINIFVNSNNGDAVRIDHCIIAGNVAIGGPGGGIYAGGSNLTITNTSISSNVASQGGGIALADNPSGGGVLIASCDVSGNTAKGSNGKAGEGGGIYNEDEWVSLNVLYTYIANNTVTGGPTMSGSEGSGFGGGIYNSGITTIEDSTLYHNAATHSWGIGQGGAIYAYNGVLHAFNNTLTMNSATDLGGGLIGNGADFTSTIIARNSAPSSPDVFGSFISGGFNLIGIDQSNFSFQSTDLKGTGSVPVDPKLDPGGPKGNGGPTATIALVCGSPAIDKGNNPNLRPTDQRGAGFSRKFDDPNVPNADGGDGTDIGAFEVQQSCGAPTPTPTPTPSPSPIPTPTPNAVQFSSSSYSIQEDCTTVPITITRIGDTSGSATVDYSTSDVTASERRDYIKAIGTLRFAAGETSKSFGVLINEDSYVEGNETFNITLSNPSGVGLGGPLIATVTIVDDPSEPAANPLDDPQAFVCQQYHDFLNRQPDPPGLAFWTNEIASCGSNQQCIEAKRINVSAAFFLSIEFQQTGYLIERTYKASYGDVSGNSTFPGAHQLPVPVVRLNEFLSDTQEIGQGVVVGQNGWEQQLENNKQAFTAEFVTRSRFTTAFPANLTAAQFVDTLNSNAGNPLSAADRNQLVSDLSANAKTRAQVLRTIAENSNLANAEFNRAFVLMQYFGYLRRNPNESPEPTLDYTGYDFWLTKLNQFNGNFQNAEMVKAFITSTEYRQRFGP